MPNDRNNDRAIAALRELLSARGTPQPIPGNPELPAVPTPPMFMPSPEVRGGPRLAQTMYAIEQQVPGVRNVINRVTTEPDFQTLGEYADATTLRGAIKGLLGAQTQGMIGKDPAFDPTTSWLNKIQGSAPTQNPSVVHINPAMEREIQPGTGYSPYIMETLAHEVGHQRGISHPWWGQQIMGRPSTLDVEQAALKSFPQRRK